MEEFETKMTLVEYENLQKRIKIFDDWSEDDEPKDNWTIKPQEDIPRADWDIDDDESEGEDSFRPYECRRPEPGDVQYEVGQSLRMDPDVWNTFPRNNFVPGSGRCRATVKRSGWLL